MAEWATADQVQRITNHVFLPPKLPQKADKLPQKADEDSGFLLIDTAFDAVHLLRSLLMPDSLNEAVQNAYRLLLNIKTANDLPGVQVDEASFSSTLKSLSIGETLATNVSRQNAAVLITRQPNELVFEMFELSPIAADVIEAEGRLNRTFPGQAVAVPAKLLYERDFLKMIASTISTMSRQRAPGMQPKSLKSYVLHDESRDTTNPTMVSELFLGVLRGIGCPTSISSISKNTRDEVLWKDAAVPWRRSPIWLLIRVSMQLVISRSPGGSHVLYKEVMVFIMSHILQSANRHGFAPDLIYCMAAKIDRRLRKLSAAGPPVLPHSVMLKIKDILQQSKLSLDKAWKSFQKTNLGEMNLSGLSTLNFERDTLVELPDLEKCILAMHSRRKEGAVAVFKPSSLLVSVNPSSLPNLEDKHFTASYAVANLGQVERWVARYVDDWVVANIRDNACEELLDVMVKYHKLAKSLYSGNPEATSLMVLTMFELWVACDKISLQQCPLLGKYDPGIPLDVLQSLILPFFSQMERLSKLEEYIEKRRGSSTSSSDLLFASYDRDSFASQYFDQSAAHQELLSKIESEATTARNAKLEEFRTIKARHDDLDALQNAAEHEHISTVIDSRCDPPKRQQMHSKDCKKCAYLSELDKLSILVHESPLPSNPFQAKTIVFELQIPPWLVHWREARLVLLEDVLKGDRTRVRASTKYLLSECDPHLSTKHSRRRGNPRVDLLSKSKPVCNTHYNTKTIPTLTEKELCPDNGLIYKYFDTKSKRYLGEFTFRDEVSKACTYAMPCEALQCFVVRPASAPDGPEPNTVIANQDRCPRNMTLEEYKEFGMVPLGHRIQWPNILLQLAMPSLDFKKPETTLLLLQCAYQAGPRSPNTSPPTPLRSSHDFFSHEKNAVSLLRHLTGALQRVKGNWESSQALFAFSALAARTLSLSPVHGVHMECFEFLSAVRDIAMGWVISLRDKAFAATDHADRTTFTAKSVEVALICTSTFDIDDHHLEAALDEMKDASILVQCCIVVQEGEHALTTNKEPFFALLEMRRKRLLCRAYKFLAQAPGVLDDAIKKAWSAYARGASWRSTSETMDHWVMTETLPTAQAASMKVQYNLLSGVLLANGLPLDQPPEKYRAHPQYSTLFGEAVVKVMPSSTPGFQFSARREFAGFSVQLGMSGSDLIVRATNGSISYETLPSRLFGGQYPTSFVEDYIHWYNVATGAVQFRPVNEPWISSSPEVWTLSRRVYGWQLAKSGYLTVGLNSSTSRNLSRVLDPLAEQAQIHNILRPSGDAGALLVNIPTLNLSFTLAQSSNLVESNEFRSMVVDADQSLGTLIGLRNKIVLKHLTSGKRMVLLPESDVKYEKCGSHVSVTIDKMSIRRVHPLRVNATLGQLVDNGELGCKIFLAYLHALTSFCLVDPLTQKTGTEQALTILQSAAVRSFDQLSQANIDILAKIAALSPGRCYYPPHKKVMQTVEWDDAISFLSQHGHFIATVQTLFEQAQQSMTFFPDAKPSFPPLESCEAHLLRRDNIRSATFRVSGFGAEDHTTQKDQRYSSRDHNSTSRLANSAFTLSRLIFRDCIKQCSSTFTTEGIWRGMGTLDIVHGLDLPMTLSSLKYDASLLRDGYKHVLRHLPPLHQCLAKSSDRQEFKFSVAMWLSTIACDPERDLPVLESIAILLRYPLGFSIFDGYAIGVDKFRPKSGYSFSREELSRQVQPYLVPLIICPKPSQSRDKHKHTTESSYQCLNDDEKHVARKAAIAMFLDGLAAQWPSANPVKPDMPSTYIRVDEAMTVVRSLFETWFDNRELHEYLRDFQRTIARLPLEPIEYVESTACAPQIRPSIPGCVTEHNMFLLPAPELPEACPAADLKLECATQEQGLDEPPRLESVIQGLERVAGQSKYETQYVANLRASLDALASRTDRSAPKGIFDLLFRSWWRNVDNGHPSVNVTSGELSSNLKSCTEYVGKLYSALKAAVMPPASSGVTGFTHQQPRISPTLFLRQLSRSRWQHLSDEWKRCIVRYALALTAMQRAERLTKLTEEQDLLNELRNPGHQNWDPVEHPETLLMEVESGCLVRDVQAQVAEQMRNPPGGNNAVMQLNMGEGKSSVIVPMVAAALADGKQLVRVVVAKPQSKQMAQMLISKLGGLLDRRVYYMPISRSLKLDSAGAARIHNMLCDCMSSGGVLLVQPEHILSLQLMVIECPILGRQDVGQQLLKTHHFLESKSRDVVDESDENFNVRFEMIYTMGTQHPIELSPDRWLLLQELLDVVRNLAPGIAEALPLSLECQPGVQGSFPRIRVLRPDGGACLKERIASHICHNGLGALQVSRQPEDIRKAVHSYITKAKLSKEDINAVERSLFWTEMTKQPLLLIRGLIACGVLEFVLSQKRWRVNYGLASRTPPTQLAVPYRAKDSPSLRSEFSHPDVVITLTSLSYYYSGLSDDDLFVAMGHLMEADQSDVEYQAWVRDANGLPAAFKQLQGINLKDRPLCTTKIFPTLRFAKSAIDFFLAHIVFPKQMREFPYKLSASGWDIGKRKDRPVTGFSGTNDSRCLLPLDVHHLDNPAQEHTNALVLEYLLKPDNGVKLMGPVTQHTSDAEHLLAAVLQLSPPVQVILDVGAQILELTNIEVAKTWLEKHDLTKEAAVFVNDDDELCVVDREDRVDLLRASSFSTRLDACLVFLDEAHTRGIDLRLPSHYRAAVTLGANLTKDRLAQACMRMRKLGKGQTVIFCISQEIQSKIMENKKAMNDSAKAPNLTITLEDVILWSVSETHADLRRSMSLWAVQALRFLRQNKFWQQIRAEGPILPAKKLAELTKRFLEKEAQSLDDRFRPRQGESQLLGLVSSLNADRRPIAERLQQFDQLQFNASTLQEEQERELSPEIEQERQVQKVQAETPDLHSLHQDVRKFALDGKFTSDSEAYMPAFEALKDSSPASEFGIWQLAGKHQLLVTADFAKTVKPSNESYISDDFQRPVQWLLTSRSKVTKVVDRIIIISPYEANKLYKHMESSEVAALHLFKPRCNSGYATLDKLDLHTVTAQTGASVVPRDLAIQLALFSGQLYISSFEDYKEICSFLGLSTQAVTQEMSEQGWEVDADGFILSDELGWLRGGAMPYESPVRFFKTLMSKIRRNGDGIGKTHMGNLLEGKLFQESDFEQ